AALPLARAMPAGRRRDTASLPPSRASRAPWPCAPPRERLLETHHRRRADCAARGDRQREPLARAAAPVRRMHLHRVGGQSVRATRDQNADPRLEEPVLFGGVEGSIPPVVWPCSLSSLPRARFTR